jgi:hypothetical protein
MKGNKFWKAVGRAYDNIEAALWALTVTSVIFFLAFVVPHLPEIREKIARTRMEEIAAENAIYCEKLGNEVGTRAYRHCLLTLGDFRVKVEQRIDRENDL